MPPTIIAIPKPTDFAFNQIILFLDRGFDECLHKVVDSCVYKAIRLEGENLLIKVWEGQSSMNVQVLTGNPPENGRLEAYVAQWFDLRRDLREFYGRLHANQPHSELGRYRGFRITFLDNLFEALAWSIIGQQINLTFAYKVKRSFVEKYGQSIIYKGEQYYFFPQPEDILGATVEGLRSLQFSNRKGEYLLGLAELFRSGKLSESTVKSLGGTPVVIKELTKIRGIGEWSANYATMKSLKKMDCIPWGDTGILDAVSRLLRLKRKPTRTEVADFYKPFVGWESYLTFYLWRSLY